MCFLLFLERSRCSPQADLSRFLHSCRRLSRLCASNRCKLLEIMPHSSTSFHLFFGFLFFVSPTSKCSAFTGPLSLSILSTCPKHCNLWSQKLFQSLSTRHITNLLIVCFIFLTYHLQHSHFCSLPLPFIFHFQCLTF